MTRPVRVRSLTMAQEGRLRVALGAVGEDEAVLGRVSGFVAELLEEQRRSIWPERDEYIEQFSAGEVAELRSFLAWPSGGFYPARRACFEAVEGGGLLVRFKPQCKVGR